MSLRLATLLLCLPAALSAQQTTAPMPIAMQSALAAKSSGTAPTPHPTVNDTSTVNYTKDETTPFDLVIAVAKQTQVAIGLVLGQYPDALHAPRSYDLRDVDARTALLEAVRGTGYFLKEKSGVFEIYAGDLTSRQRDLLTHRYQNFASNPSSTMVNLGVDLTIWMYAVIDPDHGFAASVLSSTSDETFNLGVIPSATTEEIANRIVTLGSKGMWIFRVAGSPTLSDSTDEVEVFSYQHCADLPMPSH
jgi:hypothetical protein